MLEIQGARHKMVRRPWALRINDLRLVDWPAKNHELEGYLTRRKSRLQVRQVAGDVVTYLTIIPEGVRGVVKSANRETEAEPTVRNQFQDFLWAQGAPGLPATRIRHSGGGQDSNNKIT